MVGRGEVESRMAAVARTSTVEAREANIKSAGVVLKLTSARCSHDKQVWKSARIPYDGVEALRAVFAVNRLVRAWSLKLCKLLEDIRGAKGGRHARDIDVGAAHFRVIL